MPANASIRPVPEPLAEPGGQRVRPDRIALVDEPGHVADPRVQPVGDQQVGGHVVVDQPDAEDPDPPVDDERDRGDEEGEAAAAAAIAGCAPDERSASLHRTVLASMLRTFVGSAPDARRRDTSVARERANRAASAIATAVPWPGSLIAMPLATRIAARPTGPASQVSSRRPHSERIAWPTASEAAQTTATDA